TPPQRNGTLGQMDDAAYELIRNVTRPLLQLTTAAALPTDPVRALHQRLSTSLALDYVVVSGNAMRTWQAYYLGDQFPSLLQGIMLAYCTPGAVNASHDGNALSVGHRVLIELWNYWKIDVPTEGPHAGNYGQRWFDMRIKHSNIALYTVNSAL